MFGKPSTNDRLERLEKNILKIASQHSKYETVSYTLWGHGESVHDNINHRLSKIEKFISDMGYEYKPESTTPAKWVKKPNTTKNDK